MQNGTITVPTDEDISQMWWNQGKCPRAETSHHQDANEADDAVMAIDAARRVHDLEKSTTEHSIDSVIINRLFIECPIAQQLGIVARGDVVGQFNLATRKNMRLLFPDQCPRAETSSTSHHQDANEADDAVMAIDAAKHDLKKSTTEHIIYSVVLNTLLTERVAYKQQLMDESKRLDARVADLKEVLNARVVYKDKRR